jgi:hypothetical protein
MAAKIGPLTRAATRITATEMKYMRRTVGYTWTDHKTNTDTAKELNLTQFLDKIQDYKRKWLLHVNEMPHNRLLRLIKKLTSKGKRNQGRQLKKLLDVRDWNGSTSDPTP